MSQEKRATKLVISGGAHPALARELASELAWPLAESDVTAFADGETQVHVAGDFRGSSIAIVQPTSPPVNEHVIALALLADAVKAAGAASVTAIVPYFGYARQEARTRDGDPRSAQVIGKLFGAVEIDRLITIDLHAPALESALPMPTILLTAAELFAAHVRKWNVEEPSIVSPDAGGLKRAQKFAAILKAPVAVVLKTRPKANTASAFEVLGEVRGKSCILFDDMATTGRTLAGAANVLWAAGARAVHAIFTHGVLSSGADENLKSARIGRILMSDSVPIACGERFEVVSVSSLLADALRGNEGQASPNRRRTNQLPGSAPSRSRGMLEAEIDK
jgi:ribose-phosphate pyrophosphokinase